MDRKYFYALLLVAAAWLLLPQSAEAQHTYGYSSISYDSSSNTITGYGQTVPDYGTQVYYGYPTVTSKITDASGNQLATATSQTGSVSLTVSGDGSSGYNIDSGHYIIAAFRESGLYSQCNGQYYSSSVSLDYYNYQGFSETPSTPEFYIFYDYFGPGPSCPEYEPDYVFGGSHDSAPVDCVKPAGETSTSVGWADSDNLGTMLKWTATLKPSTSNFVGRTVTEGSGTENLDTCWQSGGPADQPAQAQITGGTWTVSAGNQYGVTTPPGPDYIGYSPATVTWYRQHNRAPCGYNVEQRMYIDCPAGQTLYEDHLQTYNITKTQVSCARGSAATVTRSWP